MRFLSINFHLLKLCQRKIGQLQKLSLGFITDLMIKVQQTLGNLSVYEWESKYKMIDQNF